MEAINCFGVTKNLSLPQKLCCLLPPCIFMQCSGYTDVSLFLKDCSESAGKSLFPELGSFIENAHFKR